MQEFQVKSGVGFKNQNLLICYARDFLSEKTLCLRVLVSRKGKQHANKNLQEFIYSQDLLFPNICRSFLTGFHQNGLCHSVLIQMYFYQLLTLRTWIPVTENQFLYGFFHSGVTSIHGFQNCQALVCFILMENPQQIRIQINVCQQNIFD